MPVPPVCRFSPAVPWDHAPSARTAVHAAGMSRAVSIRMKRVVPHYEGPNILAIVVASGFVIACTGGDDPDRNLAQLSSPVDVGPCSAGTASALDTCIRNTPLGSTRP